MSLLKLYRILDKSSKLRLNAIKNLICENRLANLFIAQRIIKKIIERLLINFFDSFVKKNLYSHKLVEFQ